MKRWALLAILLYGICMPGIFVLGFMLWEGVGVCFFSRAAYPR
ncbi:MAG TPA: hypothetical protein PLW97_12040 [Synergistaceae bacterium]|nr:hypothetical protein [Synergistaceae bacterium]